MKLLKSPAELRRLREDIKRGREPGRRCLSVCGGTGCRAYQCLEVAAALKSEIERQNLAGRVELKITGCHGFCERGPLVVIHPDQIMYQRVQPEDAAGIVEESLVNLRVVAKLLYADSVTKEPIQFERDIPFYKKQQRLLFGSNGLIDPTSIEDYIAIGGYSALSKTLLEMKPEEVVAVIKESGLRGRGGGGFPTGKKWELCRSHEPSGDTRYLICNADEGDPGAYMDRSLLEGNPHSVIEGMLIGAYAIGAQKGYAYVRHEYPLAVENLTKAIEQATAYGLLGDAILGSALTFHLNIFRGAGAFVCGEETAMIASIEAYSGMPRPRPPYPVEAGLGGQPTNVNNVETWANVPMIINQGAKWFAAIGTENSKGTKIFSLVGKINNTGLVEVPMGISLREIIFDIGGGIPGGKKFKAVQTGGPSGGCIPGSLLDLPVDFDRLVEVGSMMGSGGMIVMDEDTCMVDLARYFIGFLQEESCGKCTPCREGLRHLGGILDGICKGRGTVAHLKQMEDLGWILKNGSLCGLGKTAANPILSVLRYFKDEVDAHVRDRRCPAHVCRALIKFTVDQAKCKACGKCVKACRVDAIAGGRKKTPAAIDQEKCIRCRICYTACPFKAINVD